MSSARELARLLDGSPLDARSFFDIVDRAGLEDDCGARRNPVLAEIDQSIAPAELAESPSTRSTGRAAPCFGGFLVERHGRTTNGSWQRYRVFVAPGIYLVEPWE